MFDYFLSLDQLRKKALKKAQHDVMREFYSKPFPSLKTAWDQVEILSLDFETTGLDASQDQILSYGRVCINRGMIDLSSARHQLIQAEKNIPESSAVIHHITDDQARSGQPLAEAMPELLNALAGKVMLVHFNKIEQGFLDAACQSLYGSPFMIPTIDTLKLGNRVLLHANQYLQPAQLRLFNLRDKFKLPNYKAHNAFYDALTTAELFMVLEGEITPNKSTAIKELIL